MKRHSLFLRYQRAPKIIWGILLLLSTPLFIALGQTEWSWQNPLPQGNWLHGAQVIDANNMICVGELGTVLRTTNGGTQWTVTHYTSGIAETFTDVSFVDANIGTAVGWNGAIARTTDGGVTWALQNSGTNVTLTDVVFTNANNGTVAGYFPPPVIMLRTTDGGLTWFEQFFDTDKFPQDIAFANANVGLFVGGSSTGGVGILLRTKDGGTTWSEVDPGTTASLTSVQFVDSTTVVIVGGVGTVLWSTDAGVTWVIKPSGTSANFYNVSFSSSSLGVVVSLNSLYRTTNSGESWTIIGLPTIGWLDQVSLHPSDRGLVVGNYGIIYRTANSGATWSLASSGKTATINGIVFLDENIGIGVGYGIVYRTTNAGTTWTTATLTGSLTDVAFANGSLGTAVGGSGKEGIVWRTADAGITWISQSPSESSLNAVHYANSNTGAIVGNGGTILRTTDAGLTWTIQQSGTTSGLSGVFLIDGNTGVAVGGSTILRTADGGVTWLPQASPTTESLYDVSFATPNIGVAVGGGGTILRTTDGGISWTNQISGTTIDLTAVGFDVDGTTGIIGGSGGTILWTSDAGITWTTSQTGASAAMRGVASLGENGWIAAGDGGTILHSPRTISPYPLVSVDIEIDSLDMFVPAVGDTFAYQVTLENQTSEEQTVDVWTKVLRPSGNPIDPLYGPQSVVVAPFSTVVIDTAKLPVPYNAVEGNYSLVAFVGTYQLDTLDEDTSPFVKLPQIPCDSIDQFQARCRPGGTIQARIVLLNSTEHAGEEIIMGIDGVNYGLTVVTNGTHSKAQTQFDGQTLGDHTVTLVSPIGCFDPLTVACTIAMTKADEEWFWDEEVGLENNSQADNAKVEIPAVKALLGNYPNPFNPRTDIGYQISDNGFVKLVVYDILGREVATLVNGYIDAGYHQVTLDGNPLASGVYYYRLTAGSFVDTKRLLLVK